MIVGKYMGFALKGVQTLMASYQTRNACRHEVVEGPSSRKACNTWMPTS
jgi:hypothetical protein